MPVLLFLLLLAPSTDAPAKKTGELRPIDGAKEFCSGRVYAPKGPHITWSAYASDKTRAQVVAHYLRELGKDHHSSDAKSDTWRFPTQERPTRVLSVYDHDATGPWVRKCKNKAPKSARSIIEISSWPR